MKSNYRRLRSAAAFLLLTSLIACGGGNSGNGGGGSGTPPPALLTIATDSILPGTLTNSAYSVTLRAANAVGSLTWSIAPVSPTALFVDGLSIDPGSGVLSGTANFQGTAGFIATVQDAASPPRMATKGFYLTASSPMQTPAPQTFTIGQYQDIFSISVGFPGGVQPFTYTLTAGSLPFGLTLNNQTGQITGSAITSGTYNFTVTIQDSYTPPEIAPAQITIQVVPPPLSFADSLPRQLLLNRPFSGKIVVTGGIPPYHFTMTSGTLPPGFNSIDSTTGQISGTPTSAGYYSFGVNVSDSSSPPVTANTSFGITVATPLGRNDTIATATPIGNEQIMASISPYIDPPDSAPLPADNDYYKLVSLSAAVVHVETQAQRWWPGDPVDTVIEILDSNGTQLTSCRQPGDTSTAFNSPCINDDIPSQQTTDSALDLNVPGPANTPTTFYVHVLDWRGDARPDMRYALQVSGVVTPLSITSTSIRPAARGLVYSQQLTSVNAIGAVSWTLIGGGLPPGLTLNSSGAITGTATTDGTYPFSIQASDSGTPPQTATAQVHIQVVDPLKIVSPATWPDACVNQPYTFAVQTSGGLQPFSWGFISNYWIGINVDQATGVFSGYSSITGTFNGSVGVGDATGVQVSQKITLTVKQCP